MNSVMDKTRLAEKRYRDKQNKEDFKIYNNHLQKKDNKMRKQYELNEKNLC